MSEDKLEYARNFGVDGAILNESAEALERAVNDITDGDGFDVTIEAVGLPDTFQNCIDSACFGGRVVQIGIGKKNADFNFTMIQKKELNILGSRNAFKDDFIELIGKAITDIYKFEDAVQAFEDFKSHPGKSLKVMLDFT